MTMPMNPICAECYNRKHQNCAGPPCACTCKVPGTKKRVVVAGTGVPYLEEAHVNEICCAAAREALLIVKEQLEAYIKALPIGAEQHNITSQNGLVMAIAKDTYESALAVVDANLEALK